MGVAGMKGRANIVTNIDLRDASNSVHQTENKIAEAEELMYSFFFCVHAHVTTAI